MPISLAFGTKNFSQEQTQKFFEVFYMIEKCQMGVNFWME